MGSSKQKFPMRRAAGIAATIVGTGSLLAAPVASITHYPDKSAEALAFGQEEDIPPDRLAPTLFLGGIVLTASGCKLLGVKPLYEGIEPVAAGAPPDPATENQPGAEVIPFPAPAAETEPAEKVVTA